MPRLLTILLLVASLSLQAVAHANARSVIDEQIAAHPGATGIYVLERGEESLLARAWLADHARMLSIKPLL